MESTTRPQSTLGSRSAENIQLITFRDVVIAQIPNKRSPGGDQITETSDGWQFKIESCQIHLYLAIHYLQQLPNADGDVRIAVLDTFMHGKYGRPALEALQDHLQQIHFPLPPPTISAYRAVQFFVIHALTILFSIPDLDGATALRYVVEKHLPLGLKDIGVGYTVTASTI